MTYRFAFAWVLALCALSLTTAAQADAFIKIDTIAGEATDAAHKDEIAIQSFSFGSSSSSSFTAGASSVGKVQFDALSFTHQTDRASAALLLAVARGQVLKTAVLTARKKGTTADYLKVTLTDVLVSSVKVAGTADEPAREEVVLRFGKIVFEYFSVNPRDGRVTAAGRMAWDVAANRAL
jgi:type VI secretion system secreted protein Hcp